MLFFLVMEVLKMMFCKADSWLLLHKLGARQIPHRVSLYVDDMILFVALVATDLQLVRCIFNIFEGASRLACNMAKCQLSSYLLR
jgi:hypothetical protein